MHFTIALCWLVCVKKTTRDALLLVINILPTFFFFLTWYCAANSYLPHSSVLCHLANSILLKLSFTLRCLKSNYVQYSTLICI